MQKNPNIKTYNRLLRKTVAEISALRPDADEKLRARLNKKFEKYAKKAGIDLKPKNGTTGNQNN